MWHYRLMSASKWRLKYIFYNLNKMFNCLNAIQSFLLLFIFSYCGYSAYWKFVLSNLSHIILFADMANIINIFRKGLLFLVYFYFEITQPRKNSHYILKKKKMPPWYYAVKKNAPELCVVQTWYYSVQKVGCRIKL